jgi:uncharacterized membrane protein YccC
MSTGYQRHPDDLPPRQPGRDVTMLRGFIGVLMLGMAIATVFMWLSGNTSTGDAVVVAVAWGLMVAAYVMAGHLPRARR